MGKAPLVVRNLVRNKLKRPSSPPLQAISQALLGAHPKGILGLVFYGSCLHSGFKKGDSIADIYVVVEGYHSFYGSIIPAIFNYLLPPNVYYMEVPYGDDILRLKYAVISMNQLKRATSPLWFHSYFWARFSQPMQLIYYKDERVLEELTRCICSAMFTFVSRVIPCLWPNLAVARLWQRGLELTYMAELRPEGRERARLIWEKNKRYFEDVTPPILENVCGKGWNIKKADTDKRYLVEVKNSRFLACSLPWALRIGAGKILSLFRLLKATFTFAGGVDYALWKIERHSGVRIKLGPFLRRHPILAMFVASWRLIRKKAVR